MYRTWGKRWLDLAITLPTLVVMSPILAAIAIMVRISLGVPILFRQTRPGLNGKPFTIYKFRSLTNARNAEGELLGDAHRQTPFGQFIRSTSLDELPELINVLKGQISLVGPRPLLPQYLSRYTTDQARRHEVLPGVTGLAQVNGRNALTWEEKFSFDVWYVDNLSIRLDLKILALTIWKVIRREGINPAGQATMEEFQP